MVIKAWHLLLFALLPLAIVFAGVIGSAFRGVDSEPEVFPTAAPTPGAMRGVTAGGATSVVVLVPADWDADSHAVFLRPQPALS